jgi:hypothetical protein
MKAVAGLIAVLLLAACDPAAPAVATPTPRIVRVTPSPIARATEAPTLKPIASPSPTLSPTPSPTPSPSPSPANLGTREAIVSAFEAFGFTGEDSPLADGRPRWLGQRASDGAVVEAIGPPDAITDVSLSVAASADAGTLAGIFLGTYAPGSIPFFQEVLDAAALEDQDQSRTIAGRTVRVQTLRVSDGALIVLSISAD